MAKSLPCPKCKNTITIDQTPAEKPQSVQCSKCGSTFNLTKKVGRPPVPPAAAATAPAAAHADGSPANDPFTGLDFNSLNMDGLQSQPNPDPFMQTDPFAAVPSAQPHSGQPYGGPYALAATPSESRQDSSSTTAPARKSSPLRLILLVLGATGGLAALLCGTLGFFFIRGSLLASKDERNIMLVGLAFHNYESAWKRLPAPTSLDGEQRPLWSWTGSVLPYVEDSRFDEMKHMRNMLPWDAPENELLQGPAPEIFRSARGSSGPNERNVFVISETIPIGQRPDGDEPIFVEGRYRGFSAVTDGLDKTILAIQFTKYARPWAQPGEVDAEQAYDLLQKEPGGCFVVMGDGIVNWLPSTLPKELFMKMVTCQKDDLYQSPFTAQAR